MPWVVEVEFRVISHMWSKGNVRTIPIGPLTAIERFHGRMADAVAVTSGLFTPISRKRKLSRGFYHYRKQLVSKLNRLGGRPADGFLLQVINPQNETLQLRMVAAADPHPTGRPRFEHSFTLPSGFSEHWVPLDAIRSVVDVTGDFEVSLLLGNVEPKRLYFLCAEFVSGLSGPLATRPASGQSHSRSGSPMAKCVIWDLDHTVWDGIFTEADTNLPTLREGVREVMEQLDARGIVQSVVSKNDHDTVWPYLESLGIADYFLVPQISWNPKSVGVREIVRRLNIGSDSVIIVDDQEFEREEIVTNVPGVVAWPESVIDGLLLHERMKGSTSSEARSRREYYRTQIRRESELEKLGGDYVSFLRTCELELHVHPPRPEEMDRAHELVQRTNQLNFSGNRYDRGQIEALLMKPELDSFVVSCKDRFGDYGIIGFCMIERRPASVRMKDLALSCRVQAKHVEHALLLRLLAHYAEESVSVFQAEYNRTERNTPAAKVFDDLGFSLTELENGREIYEYELSRSVESLSYISVRFLPPRRDGKSFTTLVNGVVR